MKFEEITKEEFEKQKPKNTKLKVFLEEFLGANIQYARVSWAGDYKNESICCATLKDVVNRLGMPILVKVKDHSVYLINTRYGG